MNNSLKHVHPSRIIDWVNEAIKQKSRIVAIVMDEERNTSDYEARYLHEIYTGMIEEQLIKLINQDDERYSLRFVIDVKAEIQKGFNEGLAGINYQEAKNVFTTLLLN